MGFEDMKRKLDSKYKKEKEKKQETVKQETPKVSKSTGVSASGNTGSRVKTTTPVLKEKNPFEDFRSRMERRYNPNADVDDTFLGSFMTDAQGYLERTQSDYDQMRGKSYQSAFQSRLDATTDLQRRSSTIRSFLNRNKDTLDPEQYRSTIAYLDELGRAMDDSFGYFRDARDTYESLYGRSQETMDALGAEDFRDLSRYASTRTEDLWEKMWSQYSMGYNDLTYEYINNQGGIRDEINSKSRSYRSDVGGGSSFEEKHYDYMTDDEVAVYNYYYARDGKDRAEEYLDSIGARLEARSNHETVGRVSKFADAHPIISSALSVGTSLVSGAEYIGDVLTYGAEKLQGRDTRLGTNEAALMTNAVRGTVSDKVDWEIGNWDAFDFLYSTAMSGVDSMAASAFGNFGGAVLGLSAAAQATNDALERGMSNGQAFVNGLVSGVFEGLFESVSIGNFNKLKEVAPESVKDIIKNLGKSMLVNASEETLTELANITYDTMINGEFANYTWEELKAGAWKDALQQVIEAGASGALMGVGMGGIGNAISNWNTKKNYGEFQQELVGEALEIDPENAYAKQMQERLDSGKNLRGGQLRFLVGQNEAAIDAHGDAAWENDAQEYGRILESAEKGEESAQKVTAVYAEKAEGKAKTVTLEEVSGKYGAQAQAMVKTFRDGQDVAKYDAAYKNAYDMGKSGVSMDYARNSPATAYLTAEQVELAYEAGSAAQSSFEASGDGKTLLQKDGTTVSIQGIESVSGGKMILKLEDGRTVDASEVAFASADEAMVYNAVAKMDLDGETAQMLVDGYKTGGISAHAYAIGIGQAYRYGQKNFPIADLGRAEYAAKLTGEQRMAAYEAGAAAEYARAEKAQATVAKNATTESRQGRVQFLDGGQVKDLRSHLKQRGGKLKAVQETAIGTMEKLSAALGVNFYVFESYEKDGKRMYIDENGVERPAPSGKYKGGSGEIYIDLNAGNKGQGIMLYTVAHELTHFIKDWSPAKFKTMADILMAGYAAQGQSVQELVDNQIAKAKRNGRTIDFDTAYEEVVADSMEAVLASGNVVQMMAEVKQQDQTLWQKICQWFRNLADDLKAMVEAYKGVAPDSREARLVAEVEGFLDTLEMVYGDALMDAGENFQASEKAEKNTTQEGGEDLYAFRGMNEDGIEVYETSEEVKKLPYKERQLRFLEIMKNEYRGRTAKFVRNGHAYYAAFDEKDVNKNIYGDKRSDPKGWKAKINVGAEGNIFELVENVENKAPTSDPDIRYSDRDSEGNPLSEEQVEFFRHSKVRDEQGKLLAVYHGSDSEFSEFSVNHIGSNTGNGGFYGRGFYFTTNRMDASNYGKHVLQYYLNARNPLDLNGDNWIYELGLSERKGIKTVDKIEIEKAPRGFLNIHYTTTDEPGMWRSFDGVSPYQLGEDNSGKTFVQNKINEAPNILPRDVRNLVDLARDKGFDAIIGSGTNIGDLGTEVVVFTPYQMKLTSNKAPAEGADIRFSERDPEVEKVNEVLRKENAELKYDIAHLKELLKLQRQVTGGTKFTRSSVEAAAGQLMKYANARGDKRELAGLLNHVYEYIAGGKELTWDGVKESAQPAVAWLQTHAVTRKERDSYAQDVLKEIRGSRIYLDEQQKQEVAHLYGSFSDFRKKAMGSVILTDKDAVALDTKWQEWASLWPNIFDPETGSNDMPAAMMEAFDNLRSMIEVDAYGYDAELFTQDLLSQVYDSYWKVSTLRTVADAKQKEINRLKYEHTKRMKNLREFHREKTAQLKTEHRESLQKVRQEARERTEKKLQDQSKRYRESREKAAESRRKTEMRRKIRRTIRDLDKLLNKGDKNRNVKEGMKDLVSEVLRSADVLFTDHYSNEDMVRNGVGTELTEQEAKYLNEARELMEQIGNLPSGSYEAVLDRQEQEGKLQGKLSYRMGKLQDVFARERARLAKAEVSKVLGDLADAYKGLEDAEQGYISGAFHENVYQYLLAVKGEVGGTLVKDMSLNQLDDLYRAYTMVLTTVRNANRMFAQNLKETREVLGGRAIHEIQKAGGEHGLWFPGEDKISTFSWNNQKPVYAFERIGSETLKKLFENTRAGEDTWAKDMAEARGFYLEQVRKHKYDSWDFKKQHRFTSTSGIDFDLNLEQIMSLYAYSKREQAHDHLMKGGFVFDGNTEVRVSKMGIKLTYLNKSAKAHNVSPDLLGQIVGKLTAEQKEFVDEMQDYLSTTMGGKGNSVSMELYGVKLFNEKHYFPLRSAGQYMERAKEADLKKQQGQISIVNSGFAKSVTPKASNPVVLSGFMDVWADHVNEMSMYHSFVLPMEDFRRVYNYASPNQETGQSVSVNSTIQEAYGEAATSYIDQLYRDLNGGAVSDPRENWAKSWMGKFKKAAVFASASVVVQQPSAIGRAFAIIDPKYFVGARIGAKRHNALWAELKRYAPVAAIKEMGYFDTGMGKSAQDYIKGKEYKGLKEKAAAIFTDGDYRDEVLGRLPALADELTWCAIWDAAKRETKAKNPRMDVKSEEFLKKAGQRFTEVIVKTQVYDSVLSRSANMRSKGALMSMWTAFMAEPTTTINMMEDALRKARKGDKGYAARATGAVLGSVILNSALASLVYAMRDDDDDETFLEKYAQSFATEILDGINPLTYYPFLKDVWSALQGFDIERSDMSLITSLAEKATKLVQVYGKDTEGMDEDELTAHGKEIANAWWGVVDYLTALVGIPVKNVRRDINGAFSAYSTISADLTDRDTSWGSMTDKVVSEVKNSIPVIGWLPDKTAADRLYEATVGGDTAYQKRLASSYRTENSLNNAIRKGLRANDSRIWEAAAAWNENDLETYKRIAKEIVAEGHFSQDNVVAAIQAEAKAMLPQESESASAGKAKGYFTAEKFAVAISQGNSSMASIIREDIISTAQLNGKTREEAEKSFASSAKTNVKELFLDGSISTERAIGALMTFCGNTQEEASETVVKWRAEKETGIVYNDIDDAFLAGEITESEALDMYMTYGGYTEEKATEKVGSLAFEREYPELSERITYTQYKRWQADGEPNGVDIEVFTDVAEFRDDGTSGKTKSQEEVAAYIHSLPVSTAQKDALWCCFWKASTLKNAPWH